jgi:hypothetical protein
MVEVGLEVEQSSLLITSPAQAKTEVTPEPGVIIPFHVHDDHRAIVLGL